MPYASHQREIERGEAFLVQGRPQQALRIFERVLEQDPENVDAMNDAGVACTCLDRSAEAVVHFEGALALAPGRADVFMNLVDTLLEAGELGKAKEVFVLHERGVPPSEEKERYRKALFPTAASARPVTAEGDGLPAAEGTLKVAFLCSRRDSFVLDLERAVADRHRVKVLHFDYGKVDLGAVQALMDWADVTWFEWCDQLLVAASRRLRKTSRVVCRLHSFEAFTDWPAQVRWDFVDHLVFVAPHLRRIFRDRFGLAAESSVIPNGVDLDALAFREREPSFDLAYVGGLNFKKNPELLLQCMADLVGRDPRYQLHIAGTFQELRYKLYYEKMIPALGLEENVVFHGWVDDVDAWLEDKGYLVSTSVLESFGMSIAEGMAKGLKPVIHNWVGAEEVYPPQYLFNTPAEFSRMVQAEDYDSSAYRQYIAEYYALEEQVEKIDFLLRRLCESEGSVSPGLFGGAAPQPTLRGAPAVLQPRPDRTLIVTGMPRSGTSLFSVLINHLPNAVCLNEILYDVAGLPRHFARIRRCLAEGQPIPNKFTPNGHLTTNTGDEQVVETRPIDGVDEEVVIGSKVNVPYLLRLQQLLAYDYRIIGLIRDPVFTIGSLNLEKCRSMPEAQVVDGARHARYQHFPFKTQGRITRQVELWEAFAGILWEHRDRVHLARYEDVVGDTRSVLERVCRMFDLEMPEGIPDLENMNDEARYPHMDEIREAVARYAPLRKAFGYA